MLGEPAPVPDSASCGDDSDGGIPARVRHQVSTNVIELQRADVIAGTHTDDRSEYVLKRSSAYSQVPAQRHDGYAVRQAIVDIVACASEDVQCASSGVRVRSLDVIGARVSRHLAEQIP